MKRNALDENATKLLVEVLQATVSDGACPAYRFRAKYPGALNRLDTLERNLWLWRDGAKDTYRVPLAAIPYVEHPDAKALLRDVEKLYFKLRTAYSKTLSEPIRLDSLARDQGLPRARLNLCLEYLCELPVTCGKPNLDDDNAAVAPSEGILRDDDFRRALGKRSPVRFNGQADEVALRAPEEPTFGGFTYSTPLLDVLKQAVSEFFEEQPPQQHPTKDKLIDYLRRTFDLSKHQAEAIDLILRHPDPPRDIRTRC